MARSKARIGPTFLTDAVRQRRGQGRFPGRYGLVACLVLCAICVTAATGQRLTPPARPEVRPVISGTYPNDLDGNRIDDELEGHFTLASGSSPLYGRSRSLGTTLAADKIVDVELIFDEPVTAEQIDAFVAFGGEITHLYETVSYGWNGRIAMGHVASLPAAMGPTMVLVTPAAQTVQLYMDVASQVGRARPVWQPGFAGEAEGFRGNANTTIGFIDTGVDGAHTDLAGRCVYWDDIAGESGLDPVDYDGHGSRVAGVAVGTGHSAGADDSELRYTYSQEGPSWAHIVDPIRLPSGPATVTSTAYWSGPAAHLDLVSWLWGDAEMDSIEWIGDGSEGASAVTLITTFDAVTGKLYSPLLANYRNRLLERVVITTSVADYPGVGDGFNKLSGVAPGCNYAAVKIATRDGELIEDGFAVGIDRLVAQRVAGKIKVVNISGGLMDAWGFPIESVSLRDKVTSAVRSGVIVVVAAGNSADEPMDGLRRMADPGRAALAITVGASNDENRLTDYSSYGYLNPRTYASEDFKPDLIAPGGDYYYTTILSIDSGASDGLSGPDKAPDDYAGAVGTSFASPFVAGAAGLVIEALERGGLEWDFTSDRHPRLVKMLLCATATETNANRQGGDLHPTLERDAGGPDGFAVGKDRYEGYGLINVDAAVEAAASVHTPGAPVSVELAGGPADRRAWASTVDLAAGCGIEVWLENPDEGDFDLYLYSMVPSDTGTPIILASSTTPQVGAEEFLRYTAQTDCSVLLVVKRVSGSGAFRLDSARLGTPGW
ncbi:S8 family serine peptidase [Anaerobaca lacustris]|uniref:S8 family serine peptidase n=1 Tax=Anaerobaca lacustris TaxID=3044600 RepID=A0AAW6TU00_9BACT|nr:S8 family serine peptidase [Sedimentisphaerales bacterium M17dextr]